MSTHSAKPRCDAWDAGLSEAQRWQAYAQLRHSPWHETAAWAALEFGVPAPSRSALYRWAARMRRQESAHRLEEAITARDEINALAESAGQADACLIEAYKAMAADLAVKGNAADAVKFTMMAMEIAAGQRKAAELDLKTRAQQTKDAQLKLARDKFDAAEARLAAATAAISRLKESGGISEEARKEIEKAMGLL